ncbi:substrate-binding domain-containing protein [Paraburkholderia sp. B3]|uniref:substrate-binding domain-containing protein n=1 Tax=Paraburkholderia sp. B3 TaxID=3134791 RepID=UPI003982A10D
MARQPSLMGISSMATRLVLADFVEAWRSRFAGNEATAPYIESVGGVEAARRVAEGEPFDFVVLADDALARLGTQRHVDLGTRVEVARSGVAIAVPAGAPAVVPLPALHDEDAVRRAVREARRIGYSTGPSGAHLATLLDRWGMAKTVADRLVQAPPGVPVASLLARGEVDLGFQQFSELVNVPGVQIAGALPDDIQLVTVFAAACTAATSQRAAVQAFLDFVGAPQGDGIRQRHGMEAPVRA